MGGADSGFPYPPLMRVVSRWEVGSGKWEVWFGLRKKKGGSDESVKDFV